MQVKTCLVLICIINLLAMVFTAPYAFYVGLIEIEGKISNIEKFLLLKLKMKTLDKLPRLAQLVKASSLLYGVFCRFESHTGRKASRRCT